MASKDKGIFVSASALNDYIKCSQRVYYRIFEPELKTENKEMVLGNITHKVIEKAWQNLEVALNLGKTLCEQQGVDKVGMQSVEHFIHVFFENFYPLLTKGDGVERFFKVKLDEDVYLVGKFDRVSRGMIFDWKTDTSPLKNIDNQPQFIIYDLAYKMIYGKPSDGIYYASLKEGKLIRYTESSQHANTIIDKVIPSYIDDVRNKRFIKTGLFNGSCYRCPFKNPCLGEKHGMVFADFVEE